MLLSRSQSADRGRRELGWCHAADQVRGVGEPALGSLHDGDEYGDRSRGARFAGGVAGAAAGRIRGLRVLPGRRPSLRPNSGLLAQADGRMEVWAAGVTYERSRTARMAESEQSADIYDRVYAAERPELFFKSAAWRVSGPGAPVSVRADQHRRPRARAGRGAQRRRRGRRLHHLQRHELTVHRGADPLYLPQAKTYAGGCAVGPWIVPAWELPDPYALTIELTIARDGGVAWAGTATPRPCTGRSTSWPPGCSARTSSRPG